MRCFRMRRRKDKANTKCNLKKQEDLAGKMKPKEANSERSDGGQFNPDSAWRKAANAAISILSGPVISDDGTNGFESDVQSFVDDSDGETQSPLLQDQQESASCSRKETGVTQDQSKDELPKTRLDESSAGKETKPATAASPSSNLASLIASLLSTLLAGNSSASSDHPDRSENLLEGIVQLLLEKEKRRLSAKGAGDVASEEHLNCLKAIEWLLAKRVQERQRNELLKNLASNPLLLELILKTGLNLGPANDDSQTRGDENKTVENERRDENKTAENERRDENKTAENEWMETLAEVPRDSGTKCPTKSSLDGESTDEQSFPPTVPTNEDSRATTKSPNQDSLLKIGESVADVEAKVEIDHGGLGKLTMKTEPISEDEDEEEEEAEQEEEEQEEQEEQQEEEEEEREQEQEDTHNNEACPPSPVQKTDSSKELDDNTSATPNTRDPVFVKVEPLHEDDEGNTSDNETVTQDTTNLKPTLESDRVNVIWPPKSPSQHDSTSSFNDQDWTVSSPTPPKPIAQPSKLTTGYDLGSPTSRYSRFKPFGAPRYPPPDGGVTNKYSLIPRAQHAPYHPAWYSDFCPGQTNDHVPTDVRYGANEIVREELQVHVTYPPSPIDQQFTNRSPMDDSDQGHPYRQSGDYPKVDDLWSSYQHAGNADAVSPWFIQSEKRRNTSYSFGAAAVDPPLHVPLNGMDQSSVNCEMQYQDSKRRRISTPPFPPSKFAYVPKDNRNPSKKFRGKRPMNKGKRSWTPTSPKKSRDGESRFTLTGKRDLASEDLRRKLQTKSETTPLNQISYEYKNPASLPLNDLRRKLPKKETTKTNLPYASGTMGVEGTSTERYGYSGAMKLPGWMVPADKATTAAVGNPTASYVEHQQRQNHSHFREENTIRSGMEITIDLSKDDLSTVRKLMKETRHVEIEEADRCVLTAIADNGRCEAAAIPALHRFLKLGDSKDGESLRLHELLQRSHVRLPSLPTRERNPELEARCQRLRVAQANREYKDMTRNVDARTAKDSPLSEMGREIRAINRHLVTLFNMLFTVVGSFVFAYMGTQYLYPTGPGAFASRLGVGLVTATVVFFADLYFVIRTLDEEAYEKKKAS